MAVYDRESLSRDLGELESLFQLEDVLRKRIEAKREQIFYGIMESDNIDPLRAFITQNNSGIFDKNILLEYGRLQAHLYDFAEKMIVVTQYATSEALLHSTMLRNIYFAYVRPAAIDYDVGRLLMGIPVDSHYVAYREFDVVGMLIGRTRSIPGEFLYVGPFLEGREDIGPIQEVTKEIREVPIKTYCTIMPYSTLEERQAVWETDPEGQYFYEPLSRLLVQAKMRGGLPDVVTPYPAY